MKRRLMRSYQSTNMTSGATYKQKYFTWGFLNDQFTQLQQLQDESNPDFVVEVVFLFFGDSERLLNELAKTLDQQSLDFRKVDSHVHQLKGSRSRYFENVCIAFRNFCDVQNIEGCLKCLQRVKHEYSFVKKKLETPFKQVLAAGGSILLL
ncbi:hypothetical protein PVL29_024427 [Vitis rotundifolia]|uniref:Histidine-containing phosphotransfer protein n=1 Tax=Vitis rotundifolia TaxID=103349 RepID=A0AA38YRX6_VITRO|nr:hypothetical protein PVL29_024427 [Vitis rotundifolia]